MLRVLEYSPDREAAFREITPAAIEPLIAAAGDAPLLWIDAPTPEPDEIAALAEAFQWHPLVREDLEHGNQRQKAEQFPGHIFAVLRLPQSVNGTACDLYMVQSEHVLVTLHEVPSAWIDRLARDVVSRGDLEAHRATAAVTSILAGVTDAYEETIDGLEELVLKQEAGALDADGDPAPALRRASHARSAIAEVRRSSGHLREVIGAFVRRELLNTVHTPELDLELRDVLDHAIRAHEDLDILHDRMSSLADTRLAMVAYRQNEITKKLSAWAAVLLVPTVVTGWFGQNFEHLLGLNWKYGEVYALLLVVGGMTAMWFTMRRVKWL